MNAVTFTLWDAPGFGSPWPSPVSTHWSDKRLVSVTLNRCGADEDDDLPDLTVSTMNPAVPDATLQGLVTKGLLEFSPRLMSARHISAREAAEAMVQLAQGPGTRTSLTVRDGVIDARRYEVPLTGDWVVVAVNQNYRVCVAGKRDVGVPRIEAAEIALWETPILEQVAEMASESEGQ